MAKYRYEVYKVGKLNELVYQNVTNTDSVNVRNGCDSYTPDIENKRFNRGHRFGGLRNIPNGYFVCARRYRGRWAVFINGDSTEEYCFKEESSGRKLYRIETVEKQGSFIETIVADENAYPTNGTKDGKWYIRREKIAEIKAKFNNEALTKAYYKDSQNVVRKLSKAYFKDINGNIKRLI